MRAREVTVRDEADRDFRLVPSFQKSDGPPPFCTFLDSRTTLDYAGTSPCAPMLAAAPTYILNNQTNVIGRKTILRGPTRTGRDC